MPATGTEASQRWRSSKHARGTVASHKFMSRGRSSSGVGSATNADAGTPCPLNAGSGLRPSALNGLQRDDQELRGHSKPGLVKTCSITGASMRAAMIFISRHSLSGIQGRWRGSVWVAERKSCISLDVRCGPLRSRSKCVRRRQIDPHSIVLPTPGCPRIRDCIAQMLAARPVGRVIRKLALWVSPASA